MSTPLPSRQRAMRLSLVEGVFFALMVGCGEFYFLADAVRLGASPLEQGLVITLPLCVGALGPILALTSLARWRRRKVIVIIAAAMQALLLGGAAIADAMGWSSPRLLIALVCVYQICGQAAGVAWSSWYGDVVTPEMRGRYFAKRNRLVHLSTCASLIGAGAGLQWLEPGSPGTVAAGVGGLGFAAVFTLAAVSRAVSATLLAATPEPPVGPVPSMRAAMVLLRRSGSAGLRRLLLVVAALQFFVYVGSPYFGPFMLEELRFSYLEYTAGSIAVVLAKVASLPRWGHAIDRYGPRSVYLLAIVLVALIPLPWVWADGVAWVIVAQLLSGWAWGGHELAQFTFMLDSSHPRVRLHLFAALAALAGGAQLLGGLVGGVLLGLVDRNFQILFIVTFAGRLLVASVAPLLAPHSAGRAGIGRRHLLLRLVGVRPSGGLDHRPLPVTEEGDDDPDSVT
ncbi:MAG TPA: MFS transporter [Kofleriaceae bacterium]|nr:MFS transporter [Kofleriaceae bacterium]